MSKGRRIASLAAAATAVVAVTSVVPTPVSAATETKGPEPVNVSLQTVRAHQPTFVHVWWRTDKTICDFELRVWGTPRVEVGYPANTGTYTSFSHGSRLDKREIDYTAFRVDADVAGSRWISLPAMLTYRSCAGEPRDFARTTTFRLPVHVPSAAGGGSASS
ncbi:hypothetical protein [Mangrovihabitans endophyticus]|uniref:Secreted protein n=1 Tax=Mangrovihabitans endophyticus TaxID=1751298 RepID=A0A8J3FPL1_9ACTN|nr:hypothetical protein [Mangrovihabitans endophyticus]GGL02195.1 hypothetical protein GCM10012284_40910 [Mangrovihabitans endophyticus]